MWLRILMKFIGIPDELTNLGCDLRVQATAIWYGNSWELPSVRFADSSPQRRGTKLGGKQEHRINAYPHVA